MKYKTLTLSILVLFLIIDSSSGQTPFRVMWYNVENLFDLYNDPQKQDDEFLPTGIRRWTPKRYYHKLRQLSRVITAVGEWDTPALIGLCEIENDTVISHLLNHTSLKTRNYRYCLARNSDRRGLNIALLYQRDRFKHLGDTSYAIVFSRKTAKSSREILHVWGETQTGDTLDVLLIHFPSRYGGEKESEQGRMDAANRLAIICDSLYKSRSLAYLLIMGDFNDTPYDKSLQKGLNAYPYKEKEINSGMDHSSQLYNILPVSEIPGIKGTHKHQGDWAQLDQIILSAQLLDIHSRIRLSTEGVRLFAPAFLLKEDQTWGGMRPRRTYHGYRYEGGFSDHLPLVADFLLYLSD